jgi:hypothetical protein
MRTCYWVCSLFLFCCGMAAAEDLCRIDAGPCTVAAAGMTVTLDILPKPVRAMKELTFFVEIRERGRKVEDASATIDLTMPGMVMGRNVVVLKHSSEGRYRGTGVIVRCPSGNRTWKASVAAAGRTGTTTADFLFEVH